MKFQIPSFPCKIRSSNILKWQKMMRTESWVPCSELSGSPRPPLAHLPHHVTGRPHWCFYEQFTPVINKFSSSSQLQREGQSRDQFSR